MSETELRAAQLAEWLHKHGHTFDQPTHDSWTETTDAHRLHDIAAAGKFLDALRAAPSTEPALDVERLATAMRTYVVALTTLCASHMSGQQTDADWTLAAQTLAAEYARLAESQP